MILTDTVTLDDAAVKITREGFLTAAVKAARTGIQEYRADEIGLTDRPAGEMVRVYRAPEEVFAADSLRSFSMIDATLDHPSSMVDAKNWRDLAVGSVGENVLRDGEFMVLPLILKDADAIDTWRRGKRQLSVGYECEIVLGDGVTPTGEAYSARQTQIRANHLALCDVARGGPHLRIGDSDVTLKTMTFDGILIADVSPAAEAVILKLQSQLADAKTVLATAETKIGEQTAALATKDGEIAALNQKVTDAALTPDKLDAAVAARSVVVDAAKRIIGDTFDGKGKTDVEIRRAAVLHKLGDTAKDMSDDAVAGAFKVLTPAVDANTDTLREVIADGLTNTGDAAKAATDARAKMIADMKGASAAA